MGLFEIIREHRRPGQVGSRAVVVGTRGLRAKVVPAVKIAVATAEPHQRHEVDLLVHIQTSNKAGKLGAIGILTVIFRPPYGHIVVAEDLSSNPIR